MQNDKKIQCKNISPLCKNISRICKNISYVVIEVIEVIEKKQVVEKMKLGFYFYLFNKVSFLYKIKEQYG